MLLISPDQTYKGMYPFPVCHAYDGYSMVDLANIDYVKYPRIVDVRGDVAVCRPGDVLFVPDGWWRHEQGTRETRISAPTTSSPRQPTAQRVCDTSSNRIIISFTDQSRRLSLHPGLSGDACWNAHVDVRVATGARPRTRACATLAVGRVVEQRITREEGAKDARRWLEVVKNAEEAEWLDLGTVEGQRRIDTAQVLRDEIDIGLPPPPPAADDTKNGSKTGVTTTATLNKKRKHARARGRGRWPSFLADLIDGRMLPTDWLNDDFVDPLLLSEAEAAMKKAALTGEDDANETTSRQLATVKTPIDADFAIALPDGGVLTRRAKILKDDREAYERAHPEFFVNKLRDKGWDAKYTPMSVLNPDHPDFIGKKPPNPMKK